LAWAKQHATDRRNTLKVFKSPPLPKDLPSLGNFPELEKTEQAPAEKSTPKKSGVNFFFNGSPLWQAGITAVNLEAMGRCPRKGALAKPIHGSFRTCTTANPIRRDGH
jgi:hypothetical protein